VGSGEYTQIIYKILALANWMSMKDSEEKRKAEMARTVQQQSKTAVPYDTAIKSSSSIKNEPAAGDHSPAWQQQLAHPIRQQKPSKMFFKAQELLCERVTFVWFLSASCQALDTILCETVLVNKTIKSGFPICPLKLPGI
jgi:hypothetical protein